MTIVFVSRDDAGKINLVCAGPQEVAQEAIDDQDPAVLAYLADPLGLNDSFPDLKKWQLWLAALELPSPIFKADVLAAVAGMPGFSDVEKETIRIMIEDAQEYAREDPRIDVLAQVMGISPAEMDSLWRWAASFSSM
ncbi:hypothetical protein HF263_02920 [Rhizobium leguminosarum]|uniref:hypothetical protein n=1 Tax=Rhizobium leguminosarum TaxID=384 RepID=UPI001C90D7BC|nr:hypothetical protein [Rhizobium leguminosarum]MBY3055031.1 hypothetical protein [Rhizobium leguminosarum]